MTPVLAEHEFELLTWLQPFLTGGTALAVGIQFVYLLVLTLYFLHSRIRDAGRKVYVFSQGRLHLAIVGATVVSIGMYRLLMWLRPDTNPWNFVWYYPVAVFLLLVTSVLHRIVVALINAAGVQPFIKDFSPPARAVYDCNPLVVYRYADNLLVWFLWLPGLVLTAPGSDWIKCVLGVLLLGIALSMFSMRWRMNAGNHES